MCVIQLPPDWASRMSYRPPSVRLIPSHPCNALIQPSHVTLASPLRRLRHRCTSSSTSNGGAVIKAPIEERFFSLSATTLNQKETQSIERTDFVGIADAGKVRKTNLCLGGKDEARPTA